MCFINLVKMRPPSICLVTEKPGFQKLRSQENIFFFDAVVCTMKDDASLFRIRTKQKLKKLI